MTTNKPQNAEYTSGPYRVGAINGYECILDSKGDHVHVPLEVVCAMLNAQAKAVVPFNLEALMQEIKNDAWLGDGPDNTISVELVRSRLKEALLNAKPAEAGKPVEGLQDAKTWMKAALAYRDDLIGVTGGGDLEYSIFCRINNALFALGENVVMPLPINIEASKRHREKTKDRNEQLRKIFTELGMKI